MSLSFNSSQVRKEEGRRCTILTWISMNSNNDSCCLPCHHWWCGCCFSCEKRIGGEQVRYSPQLLWTMAMTCVIAIRAWHICWSARSSQSVIVICLVVTWWHGIVVVIVQVVDSSWMVIAGPRRWWLVVAVVTKNRWKQRWWLWLRRKWFVCWWSTCDVFSKHHGYINNNI